MNIWALRKDAHIKRVLLQLAERLNGFAIDAPDDLPEAAVRLTATDGSGFSVYLFTYGQNQGRYGIHLEYPNPSDLPAGQSVEVLEDLDSSQLVALMEIHFFPSV